MLFTPDRHEPLADRRFSDASAREAIERSAARAEQELDAANGLWPRDPTDFMQPDDGRAASLYWGAAGIAWAYEELAAEGYLAQGLVRRELVEALEHRLLDDPDDPDYGEEGVWFGVAGAIAVAESLWPDAARRDRLADLATASLGSAALERLVGHPGFMALAAELHARTGEERWAALWSAGAVRLFDEWRYDEALQSWLWTQRLGKNETRYLGAAHGLVGNVQVLRQGGDLLPDARRDELERRAVDTLTRMAIVEDGHANWPPEAGGPLVNRERIRVQWCHGAPGVLTAMWNTAPDDDEWSELLLAAGRLVWDAGPLVDAPGLCHGTAGNAYALLALWQRTGDEEWLARARAFAVHAAAQVEDRAARVGHGHHSLFTGEEGVALCLASCVSGDARLPVADRLI